MKKTFLLTDDEMDFIYDLLMIAKLSSNEDEEKEFIEEIIKSIDSQTNYSDETSIN